MSLSYKKLKDRAGGPVVIALAFYINDHGSIHAAEATFVSEQCLKRTIINHEPLENSSRTYYQFVKHKFVQEPLR